MPRSRRINFAPNTRRANKIINVRTRARARPEFIIIIIYMCRARSHFFPSEYVAVTNARSSLSLSFKGHWVWKPSVTEIRRYGCSFFISPEKHSATSRLRTLVVTSIYVYFREATHHRRGGSGPLEGHRYLTDGFSLEISNRTAFTVPYVYTHLAVKTNK